MDDEKEERDTKQVYNLPIIHNRYIINIDETIGEPNKYREVFDTLIKAQNGEAIILNLNTNGGNMNTVVQFHNLLLGTPAYTNAFIFNATSAGSILAFSCDNIVVEDYSQTMIHAPTWASEGKPDEMKSQSDYFIKSSKSFFKKLYQGFLTEKEIEQVLIGKDLWFTDLETKKRLKKWTSIRARK